MPQKAKFLFDRSFDEPEEEAVAVSAPRFGVADLEAARQEGIAEGRRMGDAAARAALEQEMLAALRTLESGVAEIMRQQTAGIAALREAAARLGVAIGRKLSSNFTRLAPVDEVVAVIERCIDEQREEPRLVVRASEVVVEALRARIHAIVERGGYEGQIVLLPDDGLRGGDCRLEWADGGAIRDEAALVERITEIVMREARMTAG
ncbi:MAG: hypothetical protein KIT81_05590 [Alphaproteobacteria bacterium]|nr:hypothetical protein [Alphaproteobacteria bacterium]